MIGSIGGTLGLFIGFSLLSTLDWLNGKKNCKLTCNFPVVPSILNDSMYPLSLAAHSRFPVGFIVTAVVLPNILAPQSMLNFPVEMFQTCNTPLDNAHIIKLLFRGRNRQAVTKPPPSKVWRRLNSCPDWTFHTTSAPSCPIKTEISVSRNFRC